MKLKIVEILSAGIVLDKIAKESLEIVEAIKITKLIKSIATERESFNKRRQEILKEFADEVDGKIEFKNGKEGEEEANKKLIETANTEVEIEDVDFKIEDLKIKLTPNDIMALEKIIK